MIPFNIAPVTGKEYGYIADAINRHEVGGDLTYTKKCTKWMMDKLEAQKVLLTTSGTTALDMAILLCRLSPGDEVILPSFTFSSTATSIVNGGGVPVFVDIRPDTMNIDETKIESAITDKTKAIMVMHYAGVSCEMDTIMEIAKKYNLYVIEDAAQAFMATYKGKMLGTIGDFGCFSFHETKNISMGEGGAIVIRDKEHNELAEIYREKGTNRSRFYRGLVDKYTWVEKGGSYLPSDILAAYLFAQLDNIEEIYVSRMNTWLQYKSALKGLAGKIGFQIIPDKCEHNAHIFYLKCRDLTERTSYIKWMKEKGISCTFHYIPLHSAPAGIKYGRFSGKDIFTTSESEKLVRLPLYYNMKNGDIEYVITNTINFFEEKY